MSELTAAEAGVIIMFVHSDIIHEHIMVGIPDEKSKSIEQGTALFPIV